jgi:hypothetical protein
MAIQKFIIKSPKYFPVFVRQTLHINAVGRKLIKQVGWRL